ncbi:MAG: hypothetical protein A2014_03695 [Spirochaetes bacterium GWF1_49_6]|jgi:anti-anti-sigma factor|nr:MAG: hypothetical protein A2014_03695 [Spirochaetes bacterium GWF1_49_6]
METIIQYEIKMDGNFVILSIIGELNSQDVPEFNDQMRGVLEKSKSVLIDVMRLEYICSAGMGSLLASFNSAKAGGGNIVLVHMTGNVRKVFDFVGFGKFMRIAESLEEAKTFFS